MSGLGDVAVPSGGEVGGRWAISSRMDLRLGGWYIHGDEFPEEFSVPECLPA